MPIVNYRSGDIAAAWQSTDSGNRAGCPKRRRSSRGRAGIAAAGGDAITLVATGPRSS